MFHSLSPLATQVGFFLVLGWVAFRLWRALDPTEQERATWAPEDES